jgi:hypothetical protein
MCKLPTKLGDAALKFQKTKSLQEFIDHFTVVSHDEKFSDMNFEFTA